RLVAVLDAEQLVDVAVMVLGTRLRLDLSGVEVSQHRFFAGDGIFFDLVGRLLIRGACGCLSVALREKGSVRYIATAHPEQGAVERRALSFSGVATETDVRYLAERYRPFDL